MFFAYKKLLGRIETRTRDRIYCQTMRTVRDISRDDRARIATCSLRTLTDRLKENYSIGLYRDVWIAAIASSRKSLATQTAAICVRFHGRRVRHVYVTMQITFLARKSALIYRRGLRQRVASLTIDCNGVFVIRAYRCICMI